MYYVYILFSAKKDKYYVGQSEAIVDRVASHNSGISPYTSMTDDWALVYKEEYKTRKEAIQRENAIKRKKSRKYIEWLINSGKS